MRPLAIEVASFAVPFRMRFAHAAAARDHAQNVLVRVTDAAGRVGLGEGCPRAYVTGESVASARAFLERHRRVALGLDGLDSVEDWLVRHCADIDANPAAATALELALLDLFARQRGVPVETLLGAAPRRTPLRATAVYGLLPPAAFLALHARYRLAGMRAAKLKLGGGPGDAWRAAILSASGPLRLDANNLWPDAAAAIGPLRRLARWASAIEEPVRPRAWADLARVGEATGLAIVLDESVLGEADVAAVPEGMRALVNLRVSRLGGLLRTRAVATAAAARGFALILGAQVGETGILARAAVAAAALLPAPPVGVEAGYGSRLLAHDVVAPSPTLDRSGRLVPGIAWMPDAPGLGLTLSGAAYDSSEADSLWSCT